MTTDGRRFPWGRDGDRPLRGALRVVVEESDDGRHWWAVPSRSALAGAPGPKARMRRLKIDPHSPPAEDLWP